MAKATADQIAAWVYWPPFSRTPGRYPLTYPGSNGVWSNGGEKSSIRRSSRRTRRCSTDSMAWRARSVSPAPEMTAHDWAMESIWHSSFSADPSGVPSSKKARLYHSPSHASSSSEALREAALLRHRAARSSSPRRLGDAGEVPQVHEQKPAQPDAFSPALMADAVHAVVPIPGPDQGKAVAAHLEAAVQGPRAVFVERRPIVVTARARSRPPAGPPPGPAPRATEPPRRAPPSRRSIRR